MKTLIAPSRLASVKAAMIKAFNQDCPDEITPLLGGGSSAQMFKIRINDSYYVLRMMGLDQPIEDRNIQVLCAEYGSGLQLAPFCYYADASEGVMICDYIQQQPFTKAMILNQMPSLLKKLHYSGSIPEPHCVIFPYLNEFIQKLSAITPLQALKDYLKTIQDVMAILQAHRQLASCHNDLNSENVLYDGKQFYLIDFEAAGLEDPYFDLATICQQNCLNESEELNFLTSYLGQQPNEKEMAKLMLMKQVSYCFHVVHFFQHAYDGGMMDFNEPVPSFNAWYEGRKQGKYAYDTTKDLMLYAMVVLHQSLYEMSLPAFEKALIIINQKDDDS